MSRKKLSDLSTFWLIFITGLGFFIDSYDAFSYNVMRVPSLTSLGLTGDELTRSGIFILNTMIFGTIIGGFFWGLLGDKIGRKKALLGSIIIYSLAMIANSFIQNVETYALTRFFVGFGVAGEVGLGATLVAEILPKSKRVMGLAVFSVLGLLGVATAALSIEFFNWRVLYFVGGIAGLVLLCLRQFLMESKMFVFAKGKGGFIQPLKEIFTSKKLVLRFLSCILILAPTFFVTGILMTLSPEIAKALNIQTPVKANIMMGSYFTVAVLGDFIGAGLTQQVKSRKKAAITFLIGTLILSAFYLYGLNGAEALNFYIAGAALGLVNLWALSATISVEQFPTHLRATVSTSVYNCAKLVVIIFNLSFLSLKTYGVIHALSIIGGITILIGLICAITIRETYHADLEKIEI